MTCRCSVRHTQVLRQAAQTQIFDALLGDDLGCTIKQFSAQIAMVVVHSRTPMLSLSTYALSKMRKCCQRLHWAITNVSRSLACKAVQQGPALLFSGIGCEAYADCNECSASENQVSHNSIPTSEKPNISVAAAIDTIVYFLQSRCALLVTPNDIQRGGFHSTESHSERPFIIASAHEADGS